MSVETVGIFITLGIFALGHLLLANRWGARMDERVKALTNELHGSVIGIERRLDTLAEELKEIAARAGRVALVEQACVESRKDINKLENRIHRIETDRLKRKE